MVAGATDREHCTRSSSCLRSAAAGFDYPTGESGPGLSLVLGADGKSTLVILRLEESVSPVPRPERPGGVFEIASAGERGRSSE